ncbi:hypothetical protein H5410_055603, partial [Solanum commersonii]
MLLKEAVMKPPSASGSLKNPVKFRLPTAENLVPIRLDIEIDGKRFKDAFTWNASDPDSEVVVFARRTVKDLKFPTAFVTQIAQSIQIAKQGVASVRESRTNKKGRRGMEHLSASKVSSPALDLGKLFDPDGSIQWGKSECDAFEPIVSHLSNEEVDALEAREERLP